MHIYIHVLCQNVLSITRQLRHNGDWTFTDRFNNPDRNPRGHTYLDNSP